jgi:hypothetical protein
LPWGQNITLLTRLKTREERLRYAARAVEHGPLRRWMDGASFADLAAELGLAAPQDADKLVRAALARLHRHFGDQADE